jgi:pilus assembly protein Flp/PilA
MKCLLQRLLDRASDTYISLRKDEAGATAIEYGIIAALISVAIIGVLTAAGTSLGGVFTTVSNGLGSN